VIVNLLSNAIKYTPTSSHVKVALQALSASVRLSVSDQGDGIAPEMQRRIFEKFVQAGEAASHSSGLGLAFLQAGR
jgi:signal transduction histidine kinase